MEDFVKLIRYARYTTFRVEDETDRYRISLLGTYNGTAGKSNNNMFTFPLMCFTLVFRIFLVLAYCYVSCLILSLFMIFKNISLSV